MQIIGVKFRSSNNIYDFDAGSLEIKKGDAVIVETINGLCYGKVEVVNKDKESETELKKVIRKATEKDSQHLLTIRKKEQNALSEVKTMAKQYGLEMKVIDAEYMFDMSKLIFTFTADDRVDFRELVKSLASTFKTRIELRQVGVRDEAKILGGLGPCGRQTCCKNHLKEFEKVSVKMAKNQGLSLNPTGISGTCGRLMCCLAYEDNQYVEALSKMPKLNSKVKTPDGVGSVTYNNILKNLVSVKFVNEDGSYKINEYALSEIEFGNKDEK